MNWHLTISGVTTVFTAATISKLPEDRPTLILGLKNKSGEPSELTTLAMGPACTVADARQAGAATELHQGRCRLAKSCAATMSAG